MRGPNVIGNANLPPSHIFVEAISGLTRILSLWWRIQWKIAKVYSKNPWSCCPSKFSLACLCWNPYRQPLFIAFVKLFASAKSLPHPGSCGARCQDVVSGFKNYVFWTLHSGWNKDFQLEVVISGGLPITKDSTPKGKIVKDKAAISSLFL